MLTQDASKLTSCDYFLVYLHAKTWTSGEESEKFADEVRGAMDAGTNILLVHEMIGVGGQEARFGCEFGDFFRSPPDGTPNDLLQRGIYATIAVAMRGGVWRQASMVMLAQALAVKEEDAGGGKKAPSTAAMLAEARAREGTRARRVSLLERMVSRTKTKQVVKVEHAAAVASHRGSRGGHSLDNSSRRGSRYVAPSSQAGGHYMSSPGKVPAGATVATLKPGAGGVPPKLTSKRAARVWPDGTSYEGEWREGRATGRGRTKWVDGSSYDGAHADGRPHGEGTCTYSDGGWYEGGWARGLRHGDGVMGYADGSRWEGQWMEGRRHGRGVRVAPSGERHEEEWSHGERQLWAPPKPKRYAA